MSKPDSGHFKILYFAAASSSTGKSEEVLPAPLPLATLFQTLEQRYPGMTAEVLKHSLVTLNLEYVDVPTSEDSETSKIVIEEDDEVAIIPPVSSG